MITEIEKKIKLGLGLPMDEEQQPAHTEAAPKQPKK